jgi:hypothetical protein
MQTLVLILAVLGAAALLFRLARSVLRLFVRSAEVTAAEGLTEISVRRGDLTAMQERGAAVRQLRRTRRRDLLRAVLWLVWLAVPPAFGVAPEAYAIASPLWLLRR